MEYLVGRDSLIAGRARVVNNPKAARSCFLDLGSNNYPGLCLCSDLCFYFPVPSHPLHLSISLPSVSSSVHSFFLSTSQSTIQVNTHIHNRHHGESPPISLFACIQTATDHCAQPESQYISNTLTVRLSQKKHSNVLFESVADHYHSSKST